MLFYVKAQLTENNITTFPINDLFVLKSSKSTNTVVVFLLKFLFGIFEFQIPHKTLYLQTLLFNLYPFVCALEGLVLT